jgi:hypothetical protein
MGEEKYSDGKIYKLVAAGSLDCYIGSTCGNLAQRLWHHNHAFNNKELQNQCSSNKLFELYGNVSIQLVETFPCKTKDELHKRERYWIEQTPSALNRNLPGQTWQERWEKNKEHNAAKHKEWLAANKEAIAAERATPEFRAKETAAHKTRLADPEYAKAFKEKRSAAKKVQVECSICKKMMNKSSLWEHNKKLHTNGLIVQ